MVSLQTFFFFCNQWSVSLGCEGWVFRSILLCLQSPKLKMWGFLLRVPVRVEKMESDTEQVERPTSRAEAHTNQLSSGMSLRYIVLAFFIGKSLMYY